MIAKRRQFRLQENFVFKFRFQIKQQRAAAQLQISSTALNSPEFPYRVPTHEKNSVEHFQLFSRSSNTSYRIWQTRMNLIRRQNSSGQTHLGGISILAASIEQLDYEQTFIPAVS